ncbi:MAG: glycosyltransferase family 9 protein [Candidatus Eiseniibacteriota bacterium]|jgi:heptosyltransferase-2
MARALSAERGNRLLRGVDATLGAVLLATVRRRTRRPAPATVHRLTWLKLGAIGDVLLLTAAIEALRARHPNAEITGIVSPANAAVARRLELADRWLVIEPAGDLRRPWRLAARLGSLGPCDAALCFEQWSRGTAWIFTRLAAGWRAGFWTPGHLRGRGLDWCELHRRDRHEWRNFAALAGAVGARVAGPVLRFPTTGEERAWARAAGFEDAVVLHAGAGRRPPHLRNWPEPRFIELGRALAGRGERLVVTAGPGDSADTDHIARALGTRPVTGSLGQIAAGLEMAHLLVVGNTGIMHLASAVGTPVVALHGPTDPRRFGPLGPHRLVAADYPCSPCLHLGFEYRCPAEPGACMTTIAVSAVLEACEQWLAGPPATSAGRAP